MSCASTDAVITCSSLTGERAFQSLSRKAEGGKRKTGKKTRLISGKNSKSSLGSVSTAP